MRKRNVMLVTGLVVGVLAILGGGKIYATIQTDSQTSNLVEPTEARKDIPIDAPTVIIGNSGIKSGKEEWELFVSNCGDKKAGSIRIKYEYDFEELYADAENVNAEQMEPLDDIYVQFDGESYCYLGDGSSQKYKYLLELTGQLPNASRATTDVILADEKYSYEDVKKNEYSSNSEDHIPYQSLFFY